ncbi:hypothetical protein [Catenulispora subtropica]|uniref:Pyrrolo-quinoline quinone n=1 Tax=Catenulispora subtropica TaxID=450798 RepID=A0ABP5DNY1_9ACTN
MKHRRHAIAALLALTALAPLATADAAAWTRLPSYQTWTALTALARGQGVSTDGTYYYFSGTDSLDKVTVSNLSDVKTQFGAIPAVLGTTYGSDHIGDNDTADGYVIAPIEDGSNYQHPLLALFNASDLSYTGRYVQLPLDLMPGGVPWVAVDATAGLVYTAPWNQDSASGSDHLVVYSLSDLLTLPAGAALPPLRTVKLSQPLSRIQGAKIWRGQLWASADISGNKSVWTIDPATGTTTWQFAQDVQPNDEVEGLVALDRGPSGGQLHILNVGSGWKSIFLYFQHYASS